MISSVEDIGEYCQKIAPLLDGKKSKPALHEAIVNAPFSDVSKIVSLDLGIVVLLLINKKTNMLDRVALADTEMASGAVAMSVKPFKEIKIPADYSDNILIKAIQSGKPQMTDDWQYLFIPDLTPKQARFNQAGAGIECSVAYPLDIPDGGALIFSYYQPPSGITELHETFMKRYADIVSKKLRGMS